MSLELWSTIASVGTFLVITATAIAAVIQLKHIRSSNQIAILDGIRQVYSDAEFFKAMEFIRELDDKVEDPAFRAQLEVIPVGVAPIVMIGRFFESLGCFVKRGMLDGDLICELWAHVVYATWKSMARAIVIMRRSRGDEMFAYFEYLAYLSKQWLDANKLVYPAGIPRLAPPDRWLAVDRTERRAAEAKPS